MKDMSILIVDDSEDIRLLLKSILNPAGYDDLLFAESAKAAYEALGVGKDAQPGDETRDVDLILMDVAMPGIDGIEACGLIKENENLCDIPVVMVTALDEIKLLEVALDKGALDYIAKPFNKIELLARIRSGLRLKKEVDRRKEREKKLVETTRELEEANERLERLSSLDGLTGIGNRRSFDERIELEWSHAIRSAQPLSLIMIDVDHFKLYNDRYGHQAGDDCLKKVALLISSTIHRALDLAARYGGEEFALLLPDTNMEGARGIAEKIRAGVEGMQIEHSGSQNNNFVTISLGVASKLPVNMEKFDSFVESADKAMYRAKSEGRNRVEAALRQEENI